MGGPSQASKDNAAAQANFYKQATANANTVFGEQQDLLTQIEKVALPILNLGPNQFGFSDAEWKDLQDQILSNTTQATANAVNAAQLQQRQASGGANALPTGASEEIEANARILGEQNKADQLINARLQGYQAGSQRYSQALGAITGNAQLLSPTSYTTAATGAGESATGATKLMDSERSNLLSSIIGGVVGGAASDLTGGLTAGFMGQNNAVGNLFG